MIGVAYEWCPVQVCPSQVIAQAAVNSTVSLVLLFLGLICSFSAYNGDTIAHYWTQIEQQLCHREESLKSNMGRRQSRTAQEIFDECAPLLGDHRETSFSSSTHLISKSYQSNAFRNTESEDASENYEAKKRYKLQLPPSMDVPDMRKMLKKKDFVGSAIASIFTFCAYVCFQFYSVPFWNELYVVSHDNWTQFHSHEIKPGTDSEWLELEDFPIDMSHVMGIKTTGAALLICNGTFIALYLKQDVIVSLIKSGLCYNLFYFTLG